MQHSVRMRGRQSFSDLHSDRQNVFLVQRSGGRRPAYQLHDEEIDAVGAVVIMDGGDVRVIEAGERQGFLPKSLACCRIVALRRRKNFERDLAFQSRIASAVHLSHSTCAEWFVDSVVPEGPTNHVGSEGKLSYTRSTIIDSPIPPEMQSVASPTVLSCVCRACSSVVVIRAPVQPIG